MCLRCRGHQRESSGQSVARARVDHSLKVQVGIFTGIISRETPRSTEAADLDLEATFNDGISIQNSVGI